MRERARRLGPWRAHSLGVVVDGQNRGEFLREARLWADNLGDARLLVLSKRKMTPARMADEVLAELSEAAEASEPIRHVAFFCHGWWNGLQCGFGWRRGSTYPVATLADGLSRLVRSLEVVTLYACSCGRGPRRGSTRCGFAHELTEALGAAGLPLVRVYAHTTSGHTTRNPYVVGFAPGTHGTMLVDRDSPSWKNWVRDMRGRMRFEFQNLSDIDLWDMFNG